MGKTSIGIKTTTRKELRDVQAEMQLKSKEDKRLNMDDVMLNDECKKKLDGSYGVVTVLVWVGSDVGFQLSSAYCSAECLIEWNKKASPCVVIETI